MAKYRERFNDKARAGNVAKRNELKRKRQKQFQTDEDEQDRPAPLPQQDANAQILLPLTAEEKAERKRQLQTDLAPKTKASAAKRKRLDKYIDRQVRREERDEIFAKLAASTVDTSKFQSLKSLGQSGGGLPEAAESASGSDSGSESESESTDEFDSGSEIEEAPKSSFIDHRPAVGGFGFKNLPTVAKKPSKKVSWREKLGLPEKESESDSESDSDSDSDSESDSSSDAEDAEDAEDADSEDADSDDAEELEEPEESAEPEESEEPEEEAEEGEKDGKSAGHQFSEWAKSLQEQHVSLPTPVVADYTHTPRPIEKEAIVDFSTNGTERAGVNYVNIVRTPEIEESRVNLPATASEQQIMEAVHHHDVVVLTGETGSGKTTQVPQFLYEAGYGSPDGQTPGMIGVTQPRRVAAVAMAQRVGEELGDHGSKVGYQIRFDSKTKAETRLKFMTDGVLLRELASDLVLAKYSAIIVDEAHERSVNTDILIGLLSRVVRLRRDQGKPLKLIVMSATLRVADFTQNTTLFSKPPPLVSVEARQFPVSVHFSRRTSHDYVTEAISKAKKIHEKLPKGGILIFLTGQNEIATVVRKLRQYAKQEKHEAAQVRVDTENMEEETIDLDWNEEPEDFDEPSEEQEDFEEEEEEGFEEEYDGEETKLKILPLYSLLPTDEQMKVFEDVPKGTRLCVVATNVAETSLTIPGIRYVVDCGRAKQRVYDLETGIQKFKIQWISKAGADQRAGRAGRTGPGHCYRLYSSAVYERDFPQFSVPEIARMPIEGLVLQMKAMGIHHIVNFPFPSPPPRASLAHGVKVLEYLGALDTKGNLSDLGRQMSFFPLHPRHAKMLLIGNQHGCMGYVIALVATLSVDEPFLAEWEVIGPAPEEDEDGEEDTAAKELREKLRSRYYQVQAQFGALDPRSDAFRLLAAVAGYDYAEDSHSGSDYCAANFLRPKVMSEISKLRQQLARLVATTTRPDAVETTTKALVTKLGVPTKIQIAALKQIIAAGYIEQVAVRADSVDDVPSSAKTALTRTPYLPLMPCPDKYVYIHPGSVLAHLGTQPPEYLVYSALTTGEQENAKTRMRTLVDIPGGALVRLASGTPLITWSKPLGGAYAPKVISSTKREAWSVPRMGAAIGSGGVGWDLPVQKVVQIKRGGEWTTSLA